MLTKVYIAWVGMKQRCNNPKIPQWKCWGGRGISYDPAWKKFENFLADMGEPKEPTDSLDRIDNDGPYCKANCRWTDRKTQRHNSRGVRLVNICGETLILIKAVAKYGVVHYGIVGSRLHSGWSVEDAILTPKCNRWSRRAKSLSVA